MIKESADVEQRPLIKSSKIVYFINIFFQLFMTLEKWSHNGSFIEISTYQLLQLL